MRFYFAGAVLTAFAGIHILFQRLVIDRVVSTLVHKVSTCRGTNHYIILAVFDMAASLVLACVMLKQGSETIPDRRETSWTNMM